MKLIDLTDKTIEAWTVKYRIPGNPTRWFCVCVCGNTKKVPAYHLTHGRSTSCGCLKGKPMRGVLHDLTGRTFGRWTVMERAKSRKDRTYWLCQCSCGRVKPVAAISLVSGVSTSCRCKGIERLTKHGLYKHRDYGIFEKMRDRCLHPKSDGWKDYGGRGIRICQRWNDFGGWLEDMGPRPSKRHSIDRKDNNGHYSCGKCTECLANGWPANVRWATPSQQANNKRTSRLIPWRGVTKTITEWSKVTGINVDCIRIREHYGWSYERIFTTPVRKKRRQKILASAADIPNSPLQSAFKW